MADKRITDLPEAETVFGTDTLVLSQNGTTKSVAASLLKLIFGGEAENGIPAGGTAGQVLVKKSGTDYDAEWQTSTGGNGGATVDPTLSISGAAADAKVVGDAFEQAEQVLSQLYAAVNRPKVSTVGLSGWDDGSVLVQDANGEVYTWGIDFDSEGRPVKFTSADDNHETAVEW